jgi:hypothetical protein
VIDLNRVGGEAELTYLNEAAVSLVNYGMGVYLHFRFSASLTIFTLRLHPAATFPTTGLSIRQGRLQSVRKFTRTAGSDFNTSLSNSGSVISKNSVALVHLSVLFSTFKTF